jgi:hypothetical protein
MALACETFNNKVPEEFTNTAHPNYIRMDDDSFSQLSVMSKQSWMAFKKEFVALKERLFALKNQFEYQVDQVKDVANSLNHKLVKL